MAPTTRAGKSSSQLIAIIQQFDPILPVDEYVPIPLIAEPHHVRGAKRWLDSGRPQNVDEYAGWY